MAPKEFLLEEEIELMIEGQEDYKFTEDYNYAIAESLRLISSYLTEDALEPTLPEAEVIYDNWRKDIIFYMENNSLDGKYLTLGIDLDASDISLESLSFELPAISVSHLALRKMVEDDAGVALDQVETCMQESEIEQPKVNELISYVQKSFEWKDAKGPTIPLKIRMASLVHSLLVISLIEKNNRCYNVANRWLLSSNHVYNSS